MNNVAPHGYFVSRGIPVVGCGIARRGGSRVDGLARVATTNPSLAFPFKVVRSFTLPFTLLFSLLSLTFALSTMTIVVVCVLACVGTRQTLLTVSFAIVVELFTQGSWARQLYDIVLPVVLLLLLKR
jgi:hypothetical protein